MKDIKEMEDIRKLVDSFYKKVRKDELLGPVFEEVIQDRWPDHLDKMYKFWQTVLLGQHTYLGSPFMPHLDLPVKKQHFDRWLWLFENTTDQFFEGETAEKAKLQAGKMALMFETKIDHYKKSGGKPLV
jgi:hemoglobin